MVARVTPVMIIPDITSAPINILTSLPCFIICRFVLLLTCKRCRAFRHTSVRWRRSLQLRSSWSCLISMIFKFCCMSYSPKIMPMIMPVVMTPHITSAPIIYCSSFRFDFPSFVSVLFSLSSVPIIASVSLQLLYSFFSVFVLFSFSVIIILPPPLQLLYIKTA